MSYFFIFLQRVAGLMLSCSAVSFLRPLFLRSVSRMRSFSQRSMAESREETLQPEEEASEAGSGKAGSFEPQSGEAQLGEALEKGRWRMFASWDASIISPSDSVIVRSSRLKSCRIFPG